MDYVCQVRGMSGIGFPPGEGGGKGDERGFITIYIILEKLRYYPVYYNQNIIQKRVRR